MNKRATSLRSVFFFAPAALLAAYLGLPGGAGPAPADRTVRSGAPAAPAELPGHRNPDLRQAEARTYGWDGCDPRQVTDDAAIRRAPDAAPEDRPFVDVLVLPEPGDRLLFRHAADASSLGLGPR